MFEEISTRNSATSEQLLRVTNLYFMVELENSLRFVTQLSKAGAQAGHLLPTLVGDVDLIWIDFSEEQVHIYEGLVKLFLKHF